MCKEDRGQKGEDVQLLRAPSVVQASDLEPHWIAATASGTYRGAQPYQLTTTSILGLALGGLRPLTALYLWQQGSSNLGINVRHQGTKLG